MLCHVLSFRAWVSVLLCASLNLAQSKQIHAGNIGTIDTTCPSQTINYITATLPQQCLRTDWSRDHSSTAVHASTNSTPPSVPDATSSYVPEATRHTVSSEAPPVKGNATSSSTTAQATTNDQDIEADPLSDNANFLSFEEWKAQMLQKSGQSPEHVAGPKISQSKDARINGINNALDGYGEEGEIEIEFGGFPIPEVSTEAIAPTTTTAPDSNAAAGVVEGDQPRKRSKEAGTTSKHRFNYASFDCAATVLKTNPGSKGSTSILSENKDSYMINACSLQNKFVIVELCDDINIDTIVLGNFEFFSSTFRSFRVSVADRYPVKADKWEDIGTFEARNTRGIQPFLVENMSIWARYLRIEFLTHYGAEYYCPVSLLRVHGKTMMQDWKADVKASQGEDEDEDEPEDAPSDKIVAEPIKEASKSNTVTVTVTRGATAISTVEPGQDFSFYDDKCPRISLPGPLVEQVELLSSHCQSHWRFCNMAKVSRINYNRVVKTDVRLKLEQKNVKHTEVDKKVGKKSTSTTPAQTTTTTSGSTSGSAQLTSLSTKPNAESKANSMTNTPKAGTKATETAVPSKSSAEPKGTHGSKASTHAVASTAPQDSFFKSVSKRLQQLEANSTLSLQYIEEQSRILREAFTKVEKRQLSKTTTFLETLNATVLTELRQFRLQYDQIWQSTVLELSAQREQSQREVTALSQRLSLLADEILWQKRLAILQFGLIMLCLGLVVFSRNAAGTSTFDVPILQNMVNKQAFSRYLSLDSPPGSPSRPSSRYKRFARSWTSFKTPSDPEASDDEIKGRESSPVDVYQLPTPSSETDEPTLMNSLKGSPEPELDLALRRAQSEPNLGKESDTLLESDSEDEEADSEEPDTINDHDYDNDPREALSFMNT